MGVGSAVTGWDRCPLGPEEGQAVLSSGESLQGPSSGSDSSGCVCSGSCTRSQELNAWLEGGLMTTSRGGSETGVSEAGSNSHL